MGDVMNLGRFLSEIARRRADDVGLVWGDRRWTWRELDTRVNAVVAALKARGIGKGDRIVVHSPNSNRMFESTWIAFKLGAVWVPTNYRLTPGEVAFMGRHSGARAMLYHPDYAQHADAVKAECDDLACVVAMDEAGKARPGELAYEDLVEEGRGAAPWEEEVSHGDACWFFYTSGTTGRPKAGVLTHGQMAFVVNNHLCDLMPGTGPGDASLVVAPLSHGAGAHMLPQVAKGAKSVLPAAPRFDEDELWRLVEEHGISNMFTVPTILTRMVRHPAADRYDRSSLRYIIYAGAPMYRADQKEALEKLGKVIVQYYGLGEVTGNITVLPPELHSLDDSEMKVGSCGYPRTGMEIAIKDPEGNRLDPHDQGEICVRGPAVFAGYHDNPEANAKALKDGWFHTGDLGYLDEEGFLYITGRASDMYISGGANVYPREAEEVLLTHPAVAEVAVLGVPDPQWGESGVAVVVTHSGQRAEARELLDYLDGKLAKYKRPRRVFFWDELPKSGYGKVPKHLIRKELFDRGELVEGETV
ncbi:MAG: acyl-CoA synthetase [Rhodovibrionaceae bacterium]|nr:acyl-CoA synthetase [Rhodovibrionaceae bacterium]